MTGNFEKLHRISVPELDEMLGKPFKVLDDGFVRLIDYMGSDQAIVQAARVSYGQGTKQISEDRSLIRYLMRHYHTTPFEMCELKLHVRVPMDTWRQWIRHRTASVNEYSTRYSIAIDSAQTTLPEGWRLQKAENRQGSGEYLNSEDGVIFTESEKSLHENLRQIYKQRLDKGIAREQARKDLPLSTYTEAYWKIDLHNLLHFLYLRMDEHAQLEIREYARIIGEEIVRIWVPQTWEAFEEYRLFAERFTAVEIKIIQLLNENKTEQAITLLKEKGLLLFKEEKIIRNRERAELEEKLTKLNLKIPWL